VKGYQMFILKPPNQRLVAETKRRSVNASQKNLEKTMKYSSYDGNSPAVFESDDGEWKLHVVDCLEFMEGLTPDSIDCIWTEPPYRLSNDCVTCIGGRRVTVNKGELDRGQAIDLDHEFNRRWLAACHRILKPTGSIWVSGTLHVYPSVAMAMQQLGYRILNDIVWEKGAPSPNPSCSCFTHSTEILLWATKAQAGSNYKHNFQYQTTTPKNPDEQMENRWRFSPPALDETQFGQHPAQKPVALIARCLSATTYEEDLVFDPFAGSGSTGVAALNQGRRFIGCELDGEYANLAARRLFEAVS
jgi:site-specific DNA-methyltransferase (adenine-specific)